MKDVIYITIAEFRANLKDYLEKVSKEGKVICLKNRKHPIAKIDKWSSEG